MSALFFSYCRAGAFYGGVFSKFCGISTNTLRARSFGNILEYIPAILLLEAE